MPVLVTADADEKLLSPDSALARAVAAPFDVPLARLARLGSLLTPPFPAIGSEAACSRARGESEPFRVGQSQVLRLVRLERGSRLLACCVAGAGEGRWGRWDK